MAKKRSSANGERRSWGTWAGIGLILAAVLAAAVYWQWDRIVSTIGGTASGIWDRLGWGLLVIVLMLVSIVIAITRHRISAVARRIYSPLRYWYRWLGGFSFGFAIWGILAFLGAGGSFGMAIIGREDAAGVLRIIGLVLLGTVLVAPGAVFRGTRSVFRKRTPAVRSADPAFFSETKTRGASTRKTPAVPAPDPAASRTAAGPASRTQLEGQRDVREVAREVWKRFGKASSLVTVNGWKLPPIDILEKPVEVEFSQADNSHRAHLIEEALASYGVDAKVVQINPGPTVTQFGVEPGWDRKTREIRERDRDGSVRIRHEEVSRTRVKVDRLTALGNDIAMTLAAPSIRIEAPVPGKSMVGIEVPNTISSAVNLRSVVETTAFQKMRTKTRLVIALGKGAGGEAAVGDLAKMPHLLIAGATGSGKTVCLNTIVCSLLLYNTPDEVKFIMIDPKRVEMTPFNSIPHLSVPVIVETEKALNALRWLSQEMDKRYQRMAAAAARNIEGYNKNKVGTERMPYLVLIIDELADLMMAGFDEVEHNLCRLAQLARATGIHLVVATQRPSVDVITGLIKANFPTRISFAVTSQVDSRTILDSVGAEKLLGRGDMLYMPTEEAKPKRLQGCFVSDAETERLVYFWGSQRREETPSIRLEDVAVTRPSALKAEDPTKDPLMDTVRQLAIEHKQISVSFLQRKLRIGKARAEKLMEDLEAEKDEGEEGE